MCYTWNGGSYNGMPGHVLRNWYSIEKWNSQCPENLKPRDDTLDRGCSANCSSLVRSTLLNDPDMIAPKGVFAFGSGSSRPAMNSNRFEVVRKSKVHKFSPECAWGQRRLNSDEHAYDESIVNFTTGIDTKCAGGTISVPYLSTFLWSSTSGSHVARMLSSNREMTLSCAFGFREHRKVLISQCQHNPSCDYVVPKGLQPNRTGVK